MSYTFGSLFTGIGGIDLGLERASWTCKWQVEIDDYCRQVLSKHWPDVPRYNDVKELTGKELEAVDLICGGFPCQPISIAGRRKGPADPRWLWPEFARIVRYLRPRWVLVENVPGLRTVNEGAAFAEVLSDLARYGYDAEWAGIPAAAFGAPHLRYRVFIVAYPANAHSEGRPYIFGCTTTPTLEGFRTVSAGHWDEWPNISWTTGNRINPRWAEWYMGFPQGWTEVEGAKPQQRIAALGNAVVPQVAEWIGRQIMESRRMDECDT